VPRNDLKRLACSLLIFALFLGCGWLIYSTAIENPFSFDDRTVIERNRWIRDFSHVGDFFRGEIDSDQRFRGGYRPLVMLSLAINYHFSHYDPIPYRYVNLFFHCLNAFLAFLLALQLARLGGEPDADDWRGPLCALLVGLYFLSHPIQTQAINLIWKRTGILSSTTILLSALFFLRWAAAGRLFPYLLAHAFMLIGFCTKEDTMILPLVFLLLFLFVRPPSGTRPRRARDFLWLLPSWLLTYAFYLVLNRFFAHVGNQYLDNLLSARDYARAQIEVIYRYLGFCFLPHPLSIDHQIFPAQTAGGKLLELAGLVGLTGLVAGLVWLWRRERLLSLALLTFFVLLLPTSSFIPLSVTMDEHRLYLPLAFFGLFLVFLVRRLFERNRIFARWPVKVRAASFFFLAFLIASNAVGAYHRNKLWRSERYLWREALALDPENVRAYTNLSFLANRDGQYLEARAMAMEAVRRNPYYYVSYLNLGIAYWHLRELEAARRAFEVTLQLRPNYVNGHYNLAMLYLETGEIDQARTEGRKLIEIDPEGGAGQEILALAERREKEIKSAGIGGGAVKGGRASGSGADSPTPFPAGR
jgi:protein O-mannosyl-transferase